MQRFQVLAKPVTLRSGKVALTDEQYSLRPHCVKATKKKGVYEVIKEFQLKSGEEFGFDGHMSKADALLLDAVPVADVKKPEKTVDETPEKADPLAEVAQEPEEANTVTVADLQTKINLGFMKVKALLKEFGVEVEDNEAAITQEVFEQVVAKVTATEGGEDAV